MGLGNILYVLAIICLSNQVLTKKADVKKDFQPQVAFICQKPAMYLTEKGWVRDERSDCLEKPADILSYCKKIYPKYDITNVVESRSVKTIENWCDFGKKHCHHHGTHTVRPFRCLVGSFQSDALLVPEHCFFDHIHDRTGDTCETFDHWKKIAHESCSDRGNRLQNFAILLPCEIDRFKGVEFVCCPQNSDVSTTAATTTVISNNSFRSSTTKSTKTNAPKKDDAYSRYMHSNVKAGVNSAQSEHTSYMKAKKESRAGHQDDVTRLMKDWMEARQRIMKMKKTDPKGSKKMNKEITERFQKTYKAMEMEDMAERARLSAVHQQRVQARLNERKRLAIEHYMSVLEREHVDATRLLKTLRHYVKTEQKDKTHTINHYKHMRDFDPRAADQARHHTAEHIHMVDKRIQQAIDMLARVPRLRAKVTTQIKKFMKSFHALDETIDQVLMSEIREEQREKNRSFKPSTQPTTTTTTSTTTTYSKPTVDDTNKIDIVESFVHRESPYEFKPVIENHTEEKLSVDSRKNLVKENEDHFENEDSSEEVEKNVKTSYDDEITEDENDIPSQETFKATNNYEVKDTRHYETKDVPIVHHDEQVAPLIAHRSVQNLELEQQDSLGGDSPIVRNIAHSSSTLAIAISCVAVFLIVVAGIVLLRRRAMNSPTTHGFVEVDQTVPSPEERHVTNMQIDGYENPTYKYFELNGNQ